MKAILLGPPGAGKGTVAGAVAEFGGAQHLSTGDLFRKHIGQGTDLGKEAKSYIDAGKLVPDELTVRMVEAELREGDKLKDFVLDGFPRTIPQAEALDRMLATFGDALDVVVELDVPDQVIQERLTGRLLCRSCGAIYHKQNKATKQEGVCDLCGGEIYQRSDDKPETVTARLETYHQQTEPLHDYYQAKGLLLLIDGTQTPEATKTSIFQGLEGRGLKAQAGRQE